MEPQELQADTLNFGVSQTWVQILIQHLTSLVTLDKNLTSAYLSFLTCKTELITDLSDRFVED